MSTYTVTDVRAWLGGIPETADVTDEQCATIASAWDALDHMLSDSDPSGPERADAASGAAAYVLGDLDLHTIGQRVRDARETLDGQLGILHGVIVAASQAGIPETVIASTAGISRTTVRAKLNK